MYKDKPWLKHYDAHVPASLKPYPAVPLYQLLRDWANAHPESTACITSAHLPAFGRKKAEITYADLDSQSDALAVALGEMGIKKGDRVAIVLPNCTQFAIAFYAILKVGGIVCATNPTYPAPRMRDQLKDCGAKAVITLSLFYNTIKQIQKETDLQHVIVTNIKEYLPPLANFLFTLAKEKKEGHRITKQPEDHDLQQLLKTYGGRKPTVDVKADDLALFQYTGGTTGISKAAMSTHQALVCNTLQCKAWFSDLKEHEIFLAAIPLFHVFGMIAVMSLAVACGAPMIMVPNPRDTKEMLEVIDAYHPSVFMGVPAMYNAINNAPGVAEGKYDLRSVRVCVSGSAPLPPVTKRRFEEITGGKLTEGYGMSEAPTATHVNPTYGENRTGSIGLPISDVESRIVSLDDEQTDVPVGEIGELIIASPQLMIGYHHMPEETKHALRKDSEGTTWFYTGDIARMDEDGYFYIVDRKKDMAIIGGFKVYPNTVENILAEHPAVREICVAGIPHPNPQKVGQETLKAWVVLKPDQHLTAKELIDFGASRLTHQEVPTAVEFVDELPKTIVGKVLRRELRQKEGEKQPAGTA